MMELLGREKIDLMIVIGGFNSSNTTHLAEIAAGFKIPNYHVKDADCIISREAIEHKPLGSPKTTVTAGWLPEGPVSIGVTAGASTPNRVIEDVIERIAAVSGE
jgi:4-hydroxy-3-methylbut-2-enyl diphosphate reductase